MMTGVSTNVEITVNLLRERFFYWFMSVDPSKIFRKYSILPGIVDSRNQTGPIYLTGASRQLIFSDGTSVYEQIEKSNPPKELQYRVYKLTNIFRRLVKEAKASFTFTELPSGATHIEWRYSYIGHNWFTELILQPLVPTIWRGYMKSALTQARSLAMKELSV